MDYSLTVPEDCRINFERWDADGLLYALQDNGIPLRMYTVKHPDGLDEYIYHGDDDLRISATQVQDKDGRSIKGSIDGKVDPEIVHDIIRDFTIRKQPEVDSKKVEAGSHTNV